MAIDALKELEAAKENLDRVISALLKKGDARHLGKLGAARYEIAETLIQLKKEDEVNAPTSCVG